MLALVGTVMSRSPSGNVLLRDGDGVLGTHRLTADKRCVDQTQRRHPPPTIAGNPASAA